jgi:hypothetical protein
VCGSVGETKRAALVFLQLRSLDFGHFQDVTPKAYQNSAQGEAKRNPGFLYNFAIRSERAAEERLPSWHRSAALWRSSALAELDFFYFYPGFRFARRFAPPWAKLFHASGVSAAKRPSRAPRLKKPEAAS